MNKGDLIDAVASAANMSKADAGRAVDAVVSSVTSTLSNGGSVSLVGWNFLSERTCCTYGKKSTNRSKYPYSSMQCS